MLPPLFVGGLGGPELVIIFFLVILLFGANKLPKLARSTGEAMGEFQKGREEIEREIRDATSTESQRSDDEATAAYDDHDDRDDTAVDATEFEVGDDHDADTDALDAEREPGLESSANADRDTDTDRDTDVDRDTDADRDIDADRDTDRNAPSA